MHIIGICLGIMVLGTLFATRLCAVNLSQGVPHDEKA
jgi:hypothetical protein